MKPNTKKLSNQETKHQETNNPRNQETKTLFYIQVRESKAPLNIPTPIAAPDRGGPIACRGGPIAINYKHESLNCAIQ